MDNITVVAIGGGGFTHGNHANLDTLCLEQSPVPRPRIGFIATASGDDPVRIERFHSRFEGLVEEHVHLPASMTAADLAGATNALDIIYVGGGDTEAMLNHWRQSGWGDVLAAAARQGVVLAGVSAGAVCWFDAFLYSSGTGAMRPLVGLGLVAGGACPHFSTEPERRAALHAAVREGSMPASIAIDDGVGVVFRSGRLSAIFSSLPGSGAYRVGPDASGSSFEVPLSVAVV